MNARLSRITLAGVVAAFVAAPAAGAAQTGLVQVAGKLVEPAQVSQAQLSAGHDPSTRLVQIGGSLVTPSKLSAWQGAATTAAPGGTGDSSFELATGAFTGAATLGGLALLASATLLLRRRRSVAVIRGT
ncbi:MAG: LPXTG cell wall anchor domain-containing protein [Gaiellaceae bacterium]